MPFKKGQSGNPGGRAKLPEDVKHVRELAREHTAEAVQSLVKVMKTSKSDAARVSAASVVLDRGWGKAEQPLTGKDGGPIEFATKDQRDAAVLAATRADT